MKTYKVVFYTEDSTYTYEYTTSRGALAAIESCMFTFSRDHQIGSVIKVEAETFRKEKS